jgi:hypothetical protein
MPKLDESYQINNQHVDHWLRMLPNFLLEHGMLDAVVHRKEMKSYIARGLDFMTPAVA